MTDLKRLYQSELPSRAIAVYLYLRGRGQPGGGVLAGHSHHGQGTQNVGEYHKKSPPGLSPGGLSGD